MKLSPICLYFIQINILQLSCRISPKTFKYYWNTLNWTKHHWTFFPLILHWTELVIVGTSSAMKEITCGTRIFWLCLKGDGDVGSVQLYIRFWIGNIQLILSDASFYLEFLDIAATFVNNHSSEGIIDRQKWTTLQKFKYSSNKTMLEKSC